MLPQGGIYMAARPLMFVTIQALFGIPFRHRCSAYLFGILVRHRCSAYPFRHTLLVQNPYQNWSLCPVVRHTCSAYLVGIGVRHTFFGSRPKRSDLKRRTVCIITVRNPGQGPALKCAPGHDSIKDSSIIKKHWLKIEVMDNKHMIF